MVVGSFFNKYRLLVFKKIVLTLKELDKYIYFSVKIVIKFKATKSGCRSVYS